MQSSGIYRQNWFYRAFMVAVCAHYLPFFHRAKCLVTLQSFEVRWAAILPGSLRSTGGTREDASEGKNRPLRSG
jgi:hypothetical protein